MYIYEMPVYQNFLYNTRNIEIAEEILQIKFCIIQIIVQKFLNCLFLR